MTERAKQLRRSQTDAEAKLWSRLRADQLGIKFRRQHRVAGYILDFACIERSLVVELDGGQHLEQTDYDARRTGTLEQHGLRVLRFWNNDVLLRTDDVVQAILDAVNEASPPHPNPLPPLRRGRGSSPTVTLGHAATVDDAKARRSNSASDAFTALHLRARLNTTIRDYFTSRGVLEVETPIMSAAGNTEPNIDSFTTTFTGPITSGARTRYLRTSPEFPLKRLLASGIGDCYELGRVFRNGEAGSAHNPEFTMLEWYRVDFDHRRLALECAQLVRAALALVQRDASVNATSYRDWFHAALGIDPFTADESALREPLRDFSIDPDGLTRDDWLDLLVTHRLQPPLPADGITIVYDFPASQCSLARIRPSEPPVAERFELYLGQHELANGYHELNNATEQRARFVDENRRRSARGQPELPIDENLLAVLDALPDCAGVALGTDRLLMYMLGTEAIGDVLAFPFSQA